MSAPLAQAVALYSGLELITRVTFDSRVLGQRGGRPAMEDLPCVCFQIRIADVCCAPINVLCKQDMRSA